MKFKELSNQQWIDRRPVLPTQRGRFTPYIVDLTSATTFGGINLRPITWEDASPDAEIYVMPAQASVSRAPLLYDDRLKAAPLEPAGKQIRIAVYCPKLTGLPDESVEQRIERINTAVEKAANNHAQFFLGPEYFFSKNTSHLARADDGADHCYSEAEFLQVTNAIVELGEKHPTMLLIPGTALWKNDSNQVRNTGYIVHYVEGGRSHSKNTSHDDAKYATNAGGMFVPGGKQFYDFEFDGFSARYEICADIDPSGKVGDGKELHFVSGFNYGGGMPARSHRGGVEILADGAGDGRIERPFEFKPKAEPADDDMLVKTFEVSKAVKTESSKRLEVSSFLCKRACRKTLST